MAGWRAKVYPFKLPNPEYLSCKYAIVYAILKPKIWPVASRIPSSMLGIEEECTTVIVQRTGTRRTGHQD
jgi:hypothetical protein